MILITNSLIIDISFKETLITHCHLTRTLLSKLGVMKQTIMKIILMRMI